MALDVLHHHVDCAVSSGAKIVDGDRVGMTKTSRCLALASKSSQPLGIRSDFGRKNFDRDAVAEQDVPGAIDCSHSAFAEQRFHLVLAVEHGIDDGSRIGLENLAINRTEGYGVVVFRFAGSAVFHSQRRSLTCGRIEGHGRWSQSSHRIYKIKTGFTCES